MIKQTFCLSSRRSLLAFLFPVSGIMLAVFGLLITAPIVLPKANAEETRSGGSLVITTSGDEINVDPVKRLNIGKSTITITADSATGYELFISTDEQNMYLDGDSTNTNHKISPTSGTYESPVAIYSESSPVWGYAIAGLNNFNSSYNISSPSSASRFAAVPTTDQLIASTESAITTDSVDVYYGVKNNDELLAGDYSTTVIYTAIGTAEPPVAKAILSANNSLDFRYDNLTYTQNQAYTDVQNNSTTISRVWNVPANAASETDIPWRDNWSITTVNFDSSFQNFKPTSIAYWFYRLQGAEQYNGIDTYLNTSEVTNMSYAFYRASYSKSMNIDVSGWDTSKVTNMSHTFENAHGYGYDNVSWTVGNLGYVDASHPGWDTSNVTDMSHMFDNAGYKAVTWSIGDISSWNTEKVTDMSYMFRNAGYTTSSWNPGDISKWDVGEVKNMSYMFSGAGYNATAWDVGNLGYVDNNHLGWDTKNVENMSSMFENTSKKDTDWTIGNIGSWNVGKVKNMSAMFKKTAGATMASWTVGDLGGWDVSKVEDMSFMFYEAGLES